MAITVTIAATGEKILVNGTKVSVNDIKQSLHEQKGIPVEYQVLQSCYWPKPHADVVGDRFSETLKVNFKREASRMVMNCNLK
jgi:hypothetical protein